MRVLLDESVPRRLGFLIEGHFVRTVQLCGWAGLKNGALLKAASAEFDVLVTADQNIEYQHNPTQLPISVIVLVAPNNRLDTLTPLLPKLIEALSTGIEAQFLRISA